MEWVHWALNVHRQQKLFPNDMLLGQLESLDMKTMPDLQIVLGDFAQWASTERETLRPPPEPDTVQRLARIAGA